MLRQAVVLAGGLGTRLGHLTRECPKPLMMVGGRPFLEYVIWNLARQGFDRIVLSVGYLADLVRATIGDGSGYGVNIEYSRENTPAGTAGALVVARELLDKEFLLLNGDTLFDFNYLDLCRYKEQSDLAIAMALRNVQDCSRFGRVVVNNGQVVSFGEKGYTGPGLINAGVYAMSKNVLEWIDAVPSSLERDVLPRLVDKGQVAAKAYEGFFIDIGVPESLEEAQTVVPGWRKKPAVFFDRDGVLNYDRGYVHSPEEFEWLPGAIDAIKLANDNGFLAIVVTNQAGIARGLYTEGDFLSFSRWLNDELRTRGAHLDAVYYCPHHPTEGIGEYKMACQCRKPNPGMLLKAAAEWNIDMSRSVFLGDNLSDMEAAKRAGIDGLLVQQGNVFEILKSWLTGR